VKLPFCGKKFIDTWGAKGEKKEDTKLDDATSGKASTAERG